MVPGVPAIVYEFQVGKNGRLRDQRVFLEVTTQRLILISHWLPYVREAGKWSFLAGHVTYCLLTEGKKKNWLFGRLSHLWVL